MRGVESIRQRATRYLVSSLMSFNVKFKKIDFFNDYIFGSFLMIVLILAVIINFGTFNYLYGGSQYYLKISTPANEFPITIADGVPWTGYQYQGLAFDQNGRSHQINLRTDKLNPGPFKKGSFVKVTVNVRKGITNYTSVPKSQVPNKVVAKVASNS